MEEYSGYVGLDVHKDTIAVAIAYAGRSKPKSLGIIANTKKSLLRLIAKVSPSGEVVGFCYEASSCCYEVYRWIKQAGHDCDVVAPSKIPKKSGERVKTDRRDAVKLASLHRPGELTPVRVPDEEQESMRDLSRAREEMKRAELQLKQRLGAFLLRHGKRYTAGKCKWTQRLYRWLSEVKMEHPVQQIVLEEYVDAVKQAEARVRSFDQELRRALEGWSLRPVVESLMALRGVNFLTAMSVLTELGDISRFESPRQLMGYLGLVPSEHSSGGKAKRGGITKTGNGRVRRLLVETAWCYRFPARRSHHLQQKAEKAEQEGPQRARMLGSLAVVRLLSSDLFGAVRDGERTIHAAEGNHVPAVEAFGRYVKANAQFQGYQLSDAAAGFEVTATKHGALNRRFAVDAAAGLVITHQLSGHFDEADRAADKLFASAKNTPLWYLAESCRARLALLQGDVREAVGWADAFEKELHPSDVFFFLNQRLDSSAVSAWAATVEESTRGKHRDRKKGTRVAKRFSIVTLSLPSPAC